MEKLVKSVNSIKLYYGDASVDSGKKEPLPMTTKNERQECCKVMAECVLSTSIKSNTEYTMLLGITLEMLLLCCQDAEADVRIAAEESINRVIKGTEELHFGKVLIEFYKEIKRNGSSRSLRAALVRFANLAHRIRPSKCRPFIVSLIPAFIQICAREDESIQECLSTSVAKIFPLIGSFASESEVQNLVDALMKNLSNSSAAIRRNSATCIFEVITNSNKKQTILYNTISELLDMYVTGNAVNNFMLGSLTTLRYLVPVLGSCDSSVSRRTGSFGSDKDSMVEVSFDDLVVKIFELCVHLFCSSDPSIVTSSLETLQALLKLPSDFLSGFFVSKTLQKTEFSSELLDILQGQRKTEPSLLQSPQNNLTNPENQDDKKEESSREFFDKEASEFEKQEDKDISTITEQFGDVKLTSNIQGDHTDQEINIAINPPPTELDSIKMKPDHEVHQPMATEGDKAELGPAPQVEIATHPEVKDGLSTPEDSYINEVEDIYSNAGLIKAVARLLCERILKIGSGGTKDVRVSAKNLALSCLSAILKLSPEIMFLSVLGENAPYVSEILSFRTFYDPQIRGCTLLSLAQFVVSALVTSKNDYETWITETALENREDFSIDLLVGRISTGLKDESAVCVRACIQAIAICTKRLMSSKYLHLAIRMLNELLELKDTTYWLVKVDILEVFGDINFRQLLFAKETAHHVEKLQIFAAIGDMHQNILKVAFEALTDKDSRVRRAASTMLVKSVSNSGVVIDSLKCDMATSEVATICSTFSISAGSPASVDPAQKGTVKNLLKIYHGYEKMDEQSHIAHNLSYLVGKLTELISYSTSKQLTQGCVQTLLALSTEYSVSKHPAPYNCQFITDPQRPENKKQGHGLLPLFLSMLESTWPPLDITAHANVLSLAGNYLAGITYHGFQVIGANPKMSEQETLLPSKGSSTTENPSIMSAILDPQVGAFALKLSFHILKLLAILHHVISETTPTHSNKSVLQTLQSAPSLPNTLKKKEKVDAKESLTAGNEPKMHKKSASTGKLPTGTEENEKEKTSKSTPNSPFSFAHSRVSMKVFEMLSGTYETYKITLDSDETDKFTNFLQTVLDAMCQILEITTFGDIEKYTEDILMYLKTIFAVEPTMTVQTVQQLLKGLFGTNLVCQLDLDDQMRLKPPPAPSKDQQHYKASFYQQVYHQPLNDFTMAIANASFHHYLQQENTQKASSGWFGSIKKKVEKKLTLTAKRSKGDKMSIQNYIRLFESIVIKSLKNYTMTSSAELQKHVLNLLAQLVQLRVNYCLLDSDQIFISFIIKQFESIEGGLVRNSDVLIPHVFFFLVLLSYENHHTKSVITMPKIIQLCDGVMASGWEASTHVVPALQPIVHDLFVLRAGIRQANASDLDTQREVTQSMLFRIIENPEVLTMLTTTLQYYRKENPEQWKKYSRQVTDVLLPLISHLKLKVTAHSDVVRLHILFEALSPTSLRPIDLVLGIFFMLPSSLGSLQYHERWIVKTVALLRVLLCYLKEDFLLERVKEMQVDPAMFSCEVLTFFQTGDGALQNAEELASSRGAEAAPLPEEVLSRIFLQILGFTVQRIVSESFDTMKAFTKEEDLKLLSQLLSELLLAITYICRSGSFRRLTCAMKSLLSLSEEQHDSSFYSAESLCNNFYLAALEYPLLPLFWTQLLTCVGFIDLSTWGKYTGKNIQLSPNSVPILNNGMVHRGAIIMLADYICQNQSEVEAMSWLIVNHVKEILSFHSEPPIQDFISAIQRNSPASRLFIECIRSLLSSDAKIRVSLKQRILFCMSGLHLNQSDALLSLILTDDWFLFSPILSVSEFSDRMACMRVEMMLLQVDQNNDATGNAALLSRIVALQLQIEKCKEITRFGRFVGLTKRLKHMLATGEDNPDVIFEDMSQKIVTDLPESDKSWFKNLAIRFFSENGKGSAIAEVLNILDYEDILEVVKDDKFLLRNAEKCLVFALEEITRPDDATATYSNDVSSPLLKALLETTASHLETFVSQFPTLELDLTERLDKPTFELCTENHSPVSEYWKNVFDVFAFEENQALLLILARILARCLIWQRVVGQLLQNIQHLGEQLLRLAVACFEFLLWTAIEGKDLSTELQLTCFELLHQVLKINDIQEIFYSDRNLFYSLTIGNTLNLIFQIYNGKVHSAGSAEILKSFACPVSCLSGRSMPIFVVLKACRLLDKVVSGEVSEIPAEIVELFRTSCQIVLRHPFFDKLARVPPLLFKDDMKAEELEGLSQEPAAEYLQEKEMLREYVGRINTLGWISRMQFEETWTSLLGVLVSQPIGDSSQNASPVDETAVQISCLTISALTSLVVNASMKPRGGQPTTGAFQNIPRVRQASPPDNKIGYKLNVIQCTIERELNAIITGDGIWQKSSYFQFGSNCLEIADSSLVSCNVLKSRLSLNPERRELSLLYYGIGQRSVKSFRTLHNISPLDEEPSEISPESDNFGVSTASDSSDSENEEPVATEMTTLVRPSPPVKIEHQEVDAHSCIQFLIDLYSEWFRSAGTLSPGGQSGNAASHISRLPRQFLCECLHSLILISDFFTERQQFEWMFGALNSLQLVQPSEDDVMLQYLVLGMCKAGAVLGLSKKVCDILTGMIEAAFGSILISNQTFALYGILYLLEAELKDYTRSLVNIISKFVCDQFKNVNLKTISHSQQLLRNVISVGFYLIEKAQVFLPPAHTKVFVQGIISLLSTADSKIIPDDLYILLFQRLETLITSFSLSTADCDAIAKFASDQFSSSEKPIHVLASLNLMITCMYFRLLRISEASSSEEEAQESRLLSMERISLLFDKIKSGFPLKFDILVTILPTLLDSFFSTQNMMNKVIGEFVSSLHPHPEVIAAVLHRVFQILHARGESMVVSEWVMLSLRNFTQRKPIWMAVWCLTCVFVSASTNHWINSLLPIVVAQVNRPPAEMDFENFYVSAKDFYVHQLITPLDKRSFQSIFKSVAQPGNRYQTVLDIIDKLDVELS